MCTLSLSLSGNLLCDLPNSIGNALSLSLPLSPLTLFFSLLLSSFYSISLFLSLSFSLSLLWILTCFFFYPPVEACSWRSDSTRCYPGTCSNELASQCTCTKGFTGTHCETSKCCPKIRKYYGHWMLNKWISHWEYLQWRRKLTSWRMSASWKTQPGEFWPIPLTPILPALNPPYGPTMSFGTRRTPNGTPSTLWQKPLPPLTPAGSTTMWQILSMELFMQPQNLS